jgi:hypothetical protein
MRNLLVTILLAGASTVQAGETTHYIDFVNTAQDSVTSLSVAPAGTNRFHKVALAGDTLHGGGESMTVPVVADGNGAGCLHDLRIEFANGRTLVQKNFDVCKYRSYHTGRYSRGQAQTVIASVP